jgi:hypothetical protein
MLLAMTYTGERGFFEFFKKIKSKPLKAVPAREGVTNGDGRVG